MRPDSGSRWAFVTRQWSSAAAVMSSKRREKASSSPRNLRQEARSLGARFASAEFLEACFGLARWKSSKRCSVLKAAKDVWCGSHQLRFWAEQLSERQVSRPSAFAELKYWRLSDRSCWHGSAGAGHFRFALQAETCPAWWASQRARTEFAVRAVAMSRLQLARARYSPSLRAEPTSCWNPARW